MLSRQWAVMQLALLLAALLFFLGLARGAEAWTWRDVYNHYKTYNANPPAGCTAWVEWATVGGQTNFKVWERCNGRGGIQNGTKTYDETATIGNAVTRPSTADNHACGGSSGATLLCNGTRNAQANTWGAGQTWFGFDRSSYDPWRWEPWPIENCVGNWQFGAGTWPVTQTAKDCFGNVTTQAAAGVSGYSTTASCKVGASGETALNCPGMDLLIGNYENVTSQCNLQVTSGSSLPHDCSCLPFGFGNTVVHNAAANSCISYRVTGDPGLASGSAGWKGGATDGTGITQGSSRRDGDVGTNADGSTSSGSGIPTNPVGTPAGTGTGSVPVSGGGPGGSVPVSGTGAGGSVPVSGKAPDGSSKEVAVTPGGAIKTDIQEEAETSGTASIPPAHTAADYPSEVDSVKPEEQDWTELVTDFLAQTPLVSAIRGSGIQVSSELCRIEGSFMGHVIPFDFCPLEGLLQSFAIFIVGIATLYSLLILTGRA